MDELACFFCCEQFCLTALGSSAHNSRLPHYLMRAETLLGKLKVFVTSFLCLFIYLFLKQKKFQLCR